MGRTDSDLGGTQRGFKFAWLVLLPAGIGVAIWALFRHVVADERLFLDYVKALVWPCLLGVMLFWLRTPLRDKFAQLLRVEGFGASAQFSAERLQAQLEPELEELFSDDDAAGHVADQNNPQQEAESELAVEESTGPAVEPSLVLEKDPEAIDPDDLMGLVKALGLPVAQRQEVRNALRDPRRRYETIRTLESQARTLTKNRSLLAARNEQSRENVESVIRKSAAWGYEMGKAGAPKAIPDIEWSEDGGWRITTEVPSSPKSAVRRQRTDSIEADRIRQIRSLEEEIKELERKSFSPMEGAASLMIDGPWLNELKRRLGRVDPGNPWSMDRTRGF